MRKILKTAALAALLSTTSAFAKDIKGVQFTDTATVAGQELKLSGVGLRKKLFIDVYVAGLYVADTSKDALSDQTKQVKLVMMRDLSKAQVGDAIREGFEKNSAQEMPKLKERLDKMIAAIPDVKKGETLVITYAPGQGTTVAGRGKDLTSIDGSDFGRAVFAVWLGGKPVDENLKKGLLGR